MRAFDIEQVRADFPILGRQVYGRPLVYLDNAATTQKPRRVLAAMEDIYLTVNANVHRAEHALAAEATALYEAARDTVAEFIGAEHREEVIFTSGTTMALNVVAKGLVNQGDNVIVSEAEHHSNIVPWQLAGAQIRVLPIGEDGLPQIERLEELIDDRTRAVAVTQCSNVLGTRPDIAGIVKIAHKHGVAVVVDGAQGTVHEKVNVSKLGCDFYAFSGHKLYGPTGIGVLWGRRELLENLPPMMGGGDMVAPQEVTFARSQFAELPFRFEAGTSNYVGAVGLAEAIRYLSEFDPHDIERHERELLEIATNELLKINGLQIYGGIDSRAPIVSFNVDGVHPSDIGQILDKQGIAIRTGMHCAQPLVEHFGVSSMCRASFALYNTKQEAIALAQGVEKAVKMICR